MAILGMYGPDGQQIGESFVLGQGEPVNVVGCTHPKSRVITVEDPMPNVIAKQCQVCGIGWLIRKEKINGDKTK